MNRSAKRQLQMLNKEEVDSIVLQTWMMLDDLDTKVISKDDFVKQMKSTKKSVEDLYENRKNPFLNNEKELTDIHIVFGESTNGALKNALEELNRKNERVIRLNHMFSIGPIRDLDQKEGLEKRLEWLFYRVHMEDEEVFNYVQDNLQDIEEIRNIPDNVRVTIWYGNNAHEQVGLRFVLFLLNEWVGDIRTLNVYEVWGNLFNRSDNYPLHTAELSPKHLGMMLDQNSDEMISNEERIWLEKEWLMLSEQNYNLRIWNKEIHSKSEDYFDNMILNNLKKLHEESGENNYIKAARLIGEILGHMPQVVGDDYIEYRIVHLVLEKVLDIKGIPRGMRYYEVKLRDL
ncbi:DUF1835 domain-containing protein (plasmid) [Pseudalkalibacillus hwajinpoensis]|uniref:DUF1835 domain-containing protein n=1 Tax=Guptibacillus hwajinpoensis TaxID=208199 RepID=UPI00325B33A5